MSNLRIAVNAFETAFVVIDSVAMISAWVIRTKLLELTRSIRTSNMCLCCNFNCLTADVYAGVKMLRNVH